MSIETTNADAEIENRDEATNEFILNWAEEFGVQRDDTKNGFNSLKAGTKPTIDQLDLSKGALTNVSHVVGLFFDVENENLPYGDFVEDIDTTPVSVHGHGHLGEGVYTFKHPNGNSTTFSVERIQKAGNVLGFDVIHNLEQVEVHGSENHPIKIHDDETDCYILIAPRVRRGD